MIPGPAGKLEALLQERDAHDPAFSAIVCHPHPLYGGTMHNKVVHRLAAVLHDLGGAVVRFNFRGVGASEGAFGDGTGELEDARAVFAWARSRHATSPFWVAGFSFGSWVAAGIASSEPDIERLIVVAPPVTTMDFSVLRTVQVPKLVVQGTADQQCPREALEREYPTWSEPKGILFVDGASHFFDRQLGDLADALRQALAGPMAGGTS